MNYLNAAIREDNHLGSGFEVGHSYFCDPPLGGDEDAWFSFVVQHEIEPLLREYWFDDLSSAEQQSELLRD